MSFVNATLVLSIGETVEEVTDSGFLGTTPTLSCSQLGDDALVQVRYTWLCLFKAIQVLSIVQGPVVQSIVSLMSSLRGQLLVFTTYY